jgi:hypothetical protein
MDSKLDVSERIIVTPPAGSLVHSLRSIGYDLKSAVADIVDNSIAAKATNINVVLDLAYDSSPYLFILDDGVGMSSDELIIAMTPGSKSPVDVRKLEDLGRFGMGLKTASFSQCLELTVVSRNVDGMVGACWCLESVAKSNTWELELLKDERCSLLLTSLKIDILETGTLVLWKKCDELTEGINDNDVLSSVIGEHVNDLREHLSLVFHKYLERKLSRIKINLNSLKLEAKDPFCTTGKLDTPISSVILTDTINVDESSKVTIKGYMLPHPTKLNKSQLQYTSPNSDYFNSQGFYIYRADRLISWGSWFRLAKKSQSNKLARVEVCIPNSVDAQWKLDIKKSKVELPSEIKKFLKSKINKLAIKSQRIFNGRTAFKRTGSQPVWERKVNSDSRRIKYEINLSNELVTNLLEDLDENNHQKVLALMKLIQLSLPTNYIANDLASSYSLNNSLDDFTKQSVIETIESLIAIGVDSESIISAFKKDDSVEDAVNEMVAEYTKERMS